MLSSKFAGEFSTGVWLCTGVLGWSIATDGYARYGEGLKCGYPWGTKFLHLAIVLPITFTLSLIIQHWIRSMDASGSSKQSTVYRYLRLTQSYMDPSIVAILVFAIIFAVAAGYDNGEVGGTCTTLAVYGKAILFLFIHVLIFDLVKLVLVTACCNKSTDELDKPLATEVHIDDDRDLYANNKLN